jgi:hypothetical protein
MWLQIWGATLEHFCPGYLAEAQASSGGASSGLRLFSSSGDGQIYMSS